MGNELLSIEVYMSGEVSAVIWDVVFHDASNNSYF